MSKPWWKAKSSLRTQFFRFGACAGGSVVPLASLLVVGLFVSAVCAVLVPGRQHTPGAVPPSTVARRGPPPPPPPPPLLSRA